MDNEQALAMASALMLQGHTWENAWRLVKAAADAMAEEVK
jgi:hypothetical protein